MCPDDAMRGWCCAGRPVKQSGDCIRATAYATAVCDQGTACARRQGAHGGVLQPQEPPRGITSEEG